jgi:hypothetical protein
MPSSSSSGMETTGVVIPRYEMVPGAILKAVEDAASVVQGSSDEGGEYFAMSLVESKLAAAVPDGAIITLPLTPPTDRQVIDFTYLAASKHVLSPLPYGHSTFTVCYGCFRTALTLA